ncbi:MAG: Crp/Fnr family transcriptional regulator [Thiofilum sp.]|uniref:Crp/Fnr family transcriptional regulator n=1 Tax=Thiofilum sp. TaxID=2212733 RepID=UPI0025D964DC|nr:Crp/Fnr family transcriptional regulator [Thiofilum sp.]MBK8453902.1 Crp/Fnr family transcriptional regulator [Thiofilum sp.]
MSDYLIDQFMALAGGREREFAAGSFLFHQGEVVDYGMIVLAGQVSLIRHQVDGSSVILQRASVQQVVAEASLFSKVYHCDGLAEVDCRLWLTPKAGLLTALQHDTTLAFSWMQYLTQQVQQARFQRELLALKTVAARLDAWLNWHEIPLPPKGEWKPLAAQLGVSPEALYRELAKRDLTH